MTRPTTFNIDIPARRFGEVLTGRRKFLLLALTHHVAEGDTLCLHEFEPTDRARRTGREATLQVAFVDAELAGLLAEPGVVAVGFDGCHLLDNGRSIWVGGERGRPVAEDGAPA